MALSFYSSTAPPTQLPTPPPHTHNLPAKQVLYPAPRQTYLCDYQCQTGLCTRGRLGSHPLMDSFLSTFKVACNLLDRVRGPGEGMEEGVCGLRCAARLS